MAGSKSMVFDEASEAATGEAVHIAWWLHLLIPNLQWPEGSGLGGSPPTNGRFSHTPEWLGIRSSINRARLVADSVDSSSSRSEPESACSPPRADRAQRKGSEKRRERNQLPSLSH
jgi:hypothetical protein